MSKLIVVERNSRDPEAEYEQGYRDALVAKKNDGTIAYSKGWKTAILHMKIAIINADTALRYLSSPWWLNNKELKYFQSVVDYGEPFRQVVKSCVEV